MNFDKATEQAKQGNWVTRKTLLFGLLLPLLLLTFATCDAGGLYIVEYKDAAEDAGEEACPSTDACMGTNGSLPPPLPTTEAGTADP